MKTLLKRQYTVAVLLLFVSLFSLSPTLTRADQQSQTGTASIDLSGQAMPFDSGNGTATPVMLSLAGIVQGIGNGEIKMQNLTGSLQIGSANYTVSNGQGDANKRGEIVIVADTSSSQDDHQLVLNGSIKGNTLAFDAPSSRLASQFFLALMGSITMNDDQGSSIIASTSLGTSESNETRHENNTSSASSATATVAINLSGQATPVENANGTTTPAMLNLIGTVERNGNGELKLQNLTGSLQIGSANYSISTGHGDSNKQGEFVIFGETSAGELILHGTIQNNSTVTVDSPSSRLSSLAYLALSGSMTVNNTGSGSAMTMSSSQNVTSTSEIENKTSIITSANATSEITQQYGSSSPLATANVTSQFSTTNATENAALTGDSTMITHLNNQTTSNALQTNVTVTTTQPSNQTITVYVTQTVANSTVTHVTTVPNATITQTSVTTVANVTVTVTNSTTSGP